VTDFNRNEAKKNQNQNGQPKKTEIFNSPNPQYFLAKISWIEVSLGK
jgi:hypothetical protein